MSGKRWMAAVLVAVLQVSSFVMHAWGQAPEPLLTIACLSDLHNQTDLIQGDVSSVRLRGTILTTLAAIRQEEDIDVMVLGGDFTSDCTIPEANWAQVRKLMREATRAAFHGKSQRPVIYVTGNHDYEVANVSGIPKPYNAARYYDFTMKNDIGVLSDDDSFYEEADNGSSGTLRLLAAYHYRIKDFDFVVLNCGKNLVHNNWNYYYSMESVEWVGKKLDQLCQQDSQRTIFFCVHIPFSDSNSISTSEKGIGHGIQSECSQRLKEILAAHPNVVMLYGHDHGYDDAYTRERTSQRVTRYDEWGEKIATIDDNHFDEPISGLTDNQAEQATSKNYSFQNQADEKFLTWKGGMAMTDASAPCRLTGTGDGSFYMEMNRSGKFLTCTEGGEFWGGDKVSVNLYEIDSQTEESLTAHRVKEIPDDGMYIVTGTCDSQAYALANDKCDPTSIAIKFDGVPVTITGETLQMPNDPRAVWTIQGARPSFLSQFMGSMRYYSNALDGNVGPVNSKIVQALMIYVYSDSIVFRIKNYGTSGIFNTSSGKLQILSSPAAYTVLYQQPSEQTTGIVERDKATLSTDPSQGRGDQSVYDLQGRKVKNLSSPLGEDQEGLKPGIYIINGRKIVCQGFR